MVQEGCHISNNIPPFIYHYKIYILLFIDSIKLHCFYFIEDPYPSKIPNPFFKNLRGNTLSGCTQQLFARSTMVTRSGTSYFVLNNHTSSNNIISHQCVQIFPTTQPTKPLGSRRICPLTLKSKRPR